MSGFYHVLVLQCRQELVPTGTAGSPWSASLGHVVEVSSSSCQVQQLCCTWFVLAGACSFELELPAASAAPASWSIIGHVAKEEGPLGSQELEPPPLQCSQVLEPPWTVGSASGTPLLLASEQPFAVGRGA